MAQAVATDRTFAIEPLLSPSDGGNSPGTSPKIYAQYPPGLPLTLVPLVAIGRAFQAAFTQLQSRYVGDFSSRSDLAERLLVSYANVPITAVTVGMLALLVLRLGYSARQAAFVSLIYAFATFAWGQARAVFPDPLLGLLVITSVHLLLRCGHKRAVAAGVALALAVLVKQTAAAAIPGLVLLPDNQGRPLWKTPSLAALVLAPLVAAGSLYMLYDIARFGGGIGGGVTPVIPSGLIIANPSAGIFGLILSPGKGVLWYAPPIIAALLAYPRFYARRPVETTAFSVIIVLWLLAYSLLGSGTMPWDGGWGWGPRYLLPVLPIALVPLAEWWEVPLARAATITLAAIGFAIQIPGAFVDFMETGHDAFQRFQRICQGCSSNDLPFWRDVIPSGSDLLTQSSLLISGKIDLALVRYWGTWLVPVTVATVVCLGIAGIALSGKALLGCSDPPEAQKGAAPSAAATTDTGV
jgi:hypothetical protein